MTVIRGITDADSGALIDLWRASWTATYRRSLGEDALATMLADLEQHGVAAMLPGAGEKGYCAVIDTQLQGSIVIAERGRIAYVWGLYVLPDQQRRGIGSELLRTAIRVIEQAETVEIRVLESSKSAMAFYAGLDFVEIGREKAELIGALTIDTIVMSAGVSSLKALLPPQDNGIQHI